MKSTHRQPSHREEPHAPLNATAIEAGSRAMPVDEADHQIVGCYAERRIAANIHPTNFEQGNYYPTS